MQVDLKGHEGQMEMDWFELVIGVKTLKPILAICISCHFITIIPLELIQNHSLLVIADRLKEDGEFKEVKVYLLFFTQDKNLKLRLPAQ